MAIINSYITHYPNNISLAALGLTYSMPSFNQSSRSSPLLTDLFSLLLQISMGLYSATTRSDNKDQITSLRDVYMDHINRSTPLTIPLMEYHGLAMVMKVLSIGFGVFFPDTCDWIHLLKLIQSSNPKLDMNQSDVTSIPSDSIPKASQGQYEALKLSNNPIDLLVNMPWELKLKLLLPLCSHMMKPRSLARIVPLSLRPYSVQISSDEDVTNICSIRKNSNLSASMSLQLDIIPSIGDHVKPGPHWTSSDGNYLNSSFKPSARNNQDSSSPSSNELFGVVIDIISWNDDIDDLINPKIFDDSNFSSNREKITSSFERNLNDISLEFASTIVSKAHEESKLKIESRDVYERSLYHVDDLGTYAKPSSKSLTVCHSLYRIVDLVVQWNTSFSSLEKL
jgi:hypothetical protein